MRRHLWLALLAAVGVGLVCEPVFAQCAMCRQALQSPEGRQMISAFRSGIVLLLLTPFAVFGTVATLAIRRSKRRQRPV